MTKIEEKLQVGDLVYYYSVHTVTTAFQKGTIEPKLGIIVKAKNLLKLYDVLIQTENIYLKDIHISWLQKAT
jgi:hypothetical protein